MKFKVTKILEAVVDLDDFQWNELTEKPEDVAYELRDEYDYTIVDIQMERVDG